MTGLEKGSVRGGLGEYGEACSPDVVRLSRRFMLTLQPVVKMEGPPAGVAAGRFDVPRPLIAALGALILVIGISAIFFRLRRGNKA